MVTNQIQASRGLKQGCVLALGYVLIKANTVPPRIGPHKLQVTQYADGLVILDHTKIGMQHALEE